MKSYVFAMVFAGALLVGCGSQKESVADLQQKQGPVQILIKPGQSFVEAQTGQKLASGDSIKTGDDARAVLELIKDKSQIALGENSFIEIKNYSEKELHQMSGTAVYKITPQNRELKIQTRHGVATVLGTELRVDTDDEKTRVSVEEGRVSFRKAAGQTSVLIESGMNYATDFTEEKAQPLDPVERNELFDGGLKPIINAR